MTRDMDNLNLRDAFFSEPDACHAALMDAARSVEEEPKVKKLTFRAVLIAAVIIVAMMTVAFAASKLMTWTDFYGPNSDVGVPKAAMEEMQVKDGETWQVGPLSFTVKEMMTDGRIAMASIHITTTDGSQALLASEPWDPIGANGENGRAYAEKLGVDPMTTWMDAAKQLNLPLYNVRGILDMAGEYYDGGMEDPMWNEDGSMVYFSMLFLKQKEAKVGQFDRSFDTGAVVDGKLPVSFFLRVDRMDSATGEEAETWEDLEQKMELTVSGIQEQKVYLPENNVSFGGFTLKSIFAQRYNTGAYLFIQFTADETATEEDAYKLYDQMAVRDGEGNRLPGGMDLSASIDTSAWPQVVLTELYGVEEMPEAITLELSTTITAK